MAHHSSQEDSGIWKHFPEKLGATGQFPEGKLTAHDEGEIKVAIGTKDNKVVIDFGQPTAWIGFTAEQAREIASTLTKHADSLS